MIRLEKLAKVIYLQDLNEDQHDFAEIKQDLWTLIKIPERGLRP